MKIYFSYAKYNKFSKANIAQDPRIYFTTYILYIRDFIIFRNINIINKINSVQEYR